MTLKEVKKALEEVQNICQAKPYCNKECPFYNVKAKTFMDCFLSPVPENWELDKINIKEVTPTEYIEEDEVLLIDKGQFEKFNKSCERRKQ